MQLKQWDLPLLFYFLSSLLCYSLCFFHALKKPLLSCIDQGYNILLWLYWFCSSTIVWGIPWSSWGWDFHLPPDACWPIIPWDICSIYCLKCTRKVSPNNSSISSLSLIVLFHHRPSQCRICPFCRTSHVWPVQSAWCDIWIFQHWC